MTHQDDLKVIGERIAIILRAERKSRTISLRQVNQELPITIATSTIHYYETRGASPEAVRLLYLLWYYRITYEEALSGKPYPPNVSRFLWEDKEFIKLCKTLLGVSINVRTQIIRAITKLVVAFGTSE